MRLFISGPMAGHMTVDGTLLPFLQRYGQPESARSFMAYWYLLSKYGRNAPKSSWEGRRAPIDHAVVTHDSNFGRRPEMPTVEQVMAYVGTYPYPSRTDLATRLLTRWEQVEEDLYREVPPTEEDLASYRAGERQQRIADFQAVGWEVEV